MSETNTPIGEDLDLVEMETAGVDEAGNLSVDDLVVVVGSGGNVVATDETIEVLTADGDVVIGETISVVGDDGELHIIEEDVTVLEASEPAKRTPAKRAARR